MEIAAELFPESLIRAYSMGFFPMDVLSEGGRRIAWFSPDPRAVMYLSRFHISRSLGRIIRQHRFHITINQHFSEVIEACADREDTWLTAQMIWAYRHLHQLGYAESIEVHQDQRLVGGVYGVKIAKAFFAESMFHRVSNMSKVALWALTRYLDTAGITFFDCQFMTDHLRSLGAENISRGQFQQLLNQAVG